MDVYHIIKRPLVTEKGTHLSQQSHGRTRTMPARGGSFSFEVHSKASKPLIKRAIEEIYKVKVQSVRTQLRKGKPRRTRRGWAQTSSWKKAIVVLEADHHIDLF